jgi:hypothetical protein
MRKLKRTFKQNRIFTQNNPLSPRICPELAKEIGLSESILLLQYEFWIATEGEEKDGQLWVRKTIREIKEVFSFWGTSTINRLINNLVDKHYMISDALDEGDRKNGRWLRFGFDHLATLASIKIICAETGQTICAELAQIIPETGQTDTQNGTNNETSPYIGSKSTKSKEISPHSRLMDFLKLRTGPIANGAREGKAAKWLLDHGYDPQQCEDCFDALVAQEWRTAAVSWVTVESQIGAWLTKGGNGHAKHRHITTDNDGRNAGAGQGYDPWNSPHAKRAY